ncbi:MAG: hypothetical protein DRP35_09395, partial [Candidatus Zixiibacteriota bacterium]
MLPQQADLTCEMHNYMADTITSADIEWSLNGTSQTTYNWTGNSYCGQNTSPIILQNNLAFAPGQYTIKANTSSPNGGSDELHTNDTLSININVSNNKRLAYQNYSNNSVPFLSNRSYGWSVSIYNKDSINFSGQIHSIAYYVTNTNGNTIAEPNQKIFIRTTNDLTNTSMNYPDTNLFTKVFEGEIDYSSTGWHIIKLDTVFNYNNFENLMILYENHAGIATVQATDFKTGWQSTDATYNYDSNVFPTGAGSVATASRIPALQLYFSIPKDAGVINLANSGVPVFTGNNDLIIDFKNFGLDTLQDIDIKYSIDQNTPGTYHWNGTIAPQNEITNLNIGNENLTYGIHDIKIWTENPNYLPDYANANDTLKVSVKACSPMSGTYTVGTAPSDFLTVKAAVDSLNNCGINGAVTFNIKHGTYNAQYILNEVCGASSINTVTFQSEIGDSTDVILTTDSADYLFNLNSADYIEFNHLTFSSDSAENFVVLDSNACNNSFIGNIFYSDTVIANYIYSGTYNDSNFVCQNNKFINGNNAIYLRGNTETEQAVIINNNIFNNQNSTSIYIEYCNKPHILNNTINSHSNGIYLKESTNININTNKIQLTDAENGIFFYHCQGDIANRNYITNNFISGNIGSAWNHSGIGLFYSSSFTNVYYNSIYITGTEQAVYLYITDNINLINNIIINNNNPIKVQSPTSLNSDYNCFYNADWNTTQSNGFMNGLLANNTDSNSIYILPYFISNSDLHTGSYFIDNKGTPLTEITTDIDGEPRNPLTPDIGADEFTSSCTGPLSGNYTIGVTGDFASFHNAVAALTDCGIQDSVTFEVESGTYNEQVTIDGNIINYTNGIKPITIVSQTTNPNDVILKYNADTLNNFTFKIKDISHLTLDGITVEADDTSFGRVIDFEGIVDSCTISNNIINGVNSANQTTCVYLEELNEDSLMIITFTGNTINNGNDGISQVNNSSTLEGLILNINNNSFNNQKRNALHISNKIASVSNNIISSTYAEYGIHANSLDSFYISNNKIILSSANAYGISIYGNVFISNNFISITNGNSGIWCNNNSKIFNNTILLKNTNSTSSCIENNSSSSILTIYNNNLINIDGDKLINN